MKCKQSISSLVPDSRHFVPATGQDDGVADVLTGSAGQDWFIFNHDGPGVLDRATDLHVGEYFTDLDIAFINGP